MRVEIPMDTLENMGVAGAVATDIATRLAALPEGLTAPETWQAVTGTILDRDIPFAVHHYVYRRIYENWDRSQGPPPAWMPSANEIEASNITALSRRVGLASAQDLFRWSAENREAFWRHMVETLDIQYKTSPERILDMTGGVEHPRWLDGGQFNIAESCFLAPADSPAIVFQAEGGRVQSMTYGKLDHLSNRFANSLRAVGLSKGDAIAIAMPMTAESVVAYLGIVKAGCAVVSIADSFAPDEIATRLRIAKAKGIVTQDVVFRAGKTLPMYQKVVDAGAHMAIVIPATGSLAVDLRESDVEWDAFLVETDSFDAVACLPDDPCNILFSSGTTGEPKAIPWTQTTPLKCAADGYLHQNIKPGDVVAWPTNLGWMMGPWLIFASLLNRGTMALYYGAPGGADFCRFIQDAKVQMLGLVPSIVKAWRASDAPQGLDWSHLKVFSSTGEISNSEDYLYLMSLADYRPVIEYCGGTEIGGGYISGTVVQYASPSTFSTPCYGLDFVILDEDGKPTNDGELFIVPPSIGLSNQLLNKDHHEVYYAGTPQSPEGEVLRRHGDQTEALGGGYYRGQGRADDTMNLSGIKVSAAEIERAVAVIDGIVETAAIAVAPPDGGPSRLVIYAVLERDKRVEKDALAKTMQGAISKGLNPLFRVFAVVPIDALPRTASNKVMRRVLRDQFVESDKDS